MTKTIKRMMTSNPPQPIANLFIRSTMYLRAIVQESARQVKSPRWIALSLSDAKIMRRCAAVELTSSSEKPIHLPAESKTQKIAVRKLRTHSLPDDDCVQRWDNEQALIIRAERNDHVGRRSFAIADVDPTRALPLEIQFLFNIDLARMRRVSVQPKSQAVGGICAGAGKTLSEQVCRNDLF